MTNNNYNGWQNYATWRVNLEVIRDYNFAEQVLESEDYKWRPDVEFLKDIVENWVFGIHPNKLGLVEDYARAFLVEVNYHEILEHILEDIDNDLEILDY